MVMVAAIVIVPGIALAAQPLTFSLLGVQNITASEALVSVAFDSNGSVYAWQNEPHIEVVYTNQATGTVVTTLPIGEAMGSRTSLFLLRNLTPNTMYTYKAVMHYDGVISETLPLSFTTASSNSSSFTSVPITPAIPTGYPTFSLLGAEEITSSEALVSVAYDSRDGQYTWSTQPKISISYTNLSNGTAGTTISVGEAVGSRTTLFRLRTLDPNTRYAYRAIMHYAGQQYASAEKTFVTKAPGQTWFTGSSTVTMATSTAINASGSSWFPSFTFLTKTVDTKISTGNLENIIKTGGSSTKNGVSLAITDSHARVVNGDTFDYTISYHNANNKSLRTARIVVQLPDQYIFDKGDGNTVYSNNENMVTIYLGTIAANESGTASFKARAVGGDDTSVETKAVLVYTGGSVSAIDRDTYAGGNPGVLGATIFGSGFFPQTFLGWLLIIVVLIIIMIVARRYMGPAVKKEEEKK